MASITEKTWPQGNSKSYADSGVTVHCFHGMRSFGKGRLLQCKEKTMMPAYQSSLNADSCRDFLLEFEIVKIRLKQDSHISCLDIIMYFPADVRKKGIEAGLRPHDVILNEESTGTSNWIWYS